MHGVDARRVRGSVRLEARDDYAVPEPIEVAHVRTCLGGGPRQADVGVNVLQARVHQLAAVAGE
jgi:hypothetical protein